MDLSLKQYRNIDLAILLAMLIAAEVVINIAARVWFPAEAEMDHGATALEDCTFLFITNAPFDIQRVEK